jgi:hypothetical protein
MKRPQTKDTKMTNTLNVKSSSKCIDAPVNVFVGTKFAGTYYPNVGGRLHGFHFCNHDGLTLAAVNLSELFALVPACALKIGTGYHAVEIDAKDIPVYDHK